MTYLVLVSHGDFARGLKNSLGMFASEEIEKVRVFGLQPGESTDNFGKRFLCEVEKLPQETRLIVLADIVGGSPLATICKVLDKQKMIVADACHGIRELTVTEDDVTENDITEEDI
ncbi:PTS fructose transporter subunit IIA [Enterococcus faecalis]